MDLCLDQWIASLVVLPALWILTNGIDDLWITMVFLSGRAKAPRVPSDEELAGAPRKRIAILVPLWREQDVIGRMLDHNIAVLRYDNYDIFAGVYVNDTGTLEAVSAACERHPHIHVAMCPQAGPTSKADCLNQIYRRLEAYERESGVRFEIIVTHDAEDLIYPRSLELIDWFAQRYDMVQVPVLPLPTPFRNLVHGLYCDEFAEYQTKDIPVRQALGGFVPSNGVGTGFTRAALEEVAAARGGRIFEPECLTEDYENGHAIHSLGRPQVFIAVQHDGKGTIATREYFPSTFRGAVRQRARWVTGIALQGWERHGWGSGREVYWFWRDRKGVLGNLLAPVVNLAFFYGIWRWLEGVVTGSPCRPEHWFPGWVSWIFTATLAMSILQMAVRAGCAERIYGWRFAAGVPVRVLLGNWLNCVATVSALAQYGVARLRRGRLAWGKTEHVYPEGELLKPHQPMLGEVLVRMRCISTGDLHETLGRQPAGRRIGEHLVELRKISERHLYEALSVQSGLPLEEPGFAAPAAVRALPADVARRWKALPVRIQAGRLYVGVTDVPGAAMRSELRRYSTLEIRYCLLKPSDAARLTAHR